MVWFPHHILSIRLTCMSSQIRHCRHIVSQALACRYSNPFALYSTNYRHNKTNTNGNAENIEQNHFVCHWWTRFNRLIQVSIYYRIQPIGLSINRRGFVTHMFAWTALVLYGKHTVIFYTFLRIKFSFFFFIQSLPMVGTNKIKTSNRCNDLQKRNLNKILRFVFS